LLTAEGMIVHASSLENMQKCYERYVCGEYLQNRQELLVLDIGGANINGSYADIFSQDKFIYLAADISPSEGVDIVLDDPYKLPLKNDSVDIVISGQAFEHVEFFWLLFEEMVRVLKSDGWLFLIAPSAGPVHRYPVDCYRFYPDAYHALAKYTGIRLMSVFHDQREPWQDLVGVFSKTDRSVIAE
jgi:SAM-dependent methyltransferase